MILRLRTTVVAILLVFALVWLRMEMHLSDATDDRVGIVRTSHSLTVSATAPMSRAPAQAQLKVHSHADGATPRNHSDDLLQSESFRACDRFDNVARPNMVSLPVSVYSNCMDALARELEDEDFNACRGQPALFHVYWAGPTFPPLPHFSLLSIIHSHGPNCVRVWLWTDSNATRDAFMEVLKPWRRSVTVHTLHWRDLASRILVRLTDSRLRYTITTRLANKDWENTTGITRTAYSNIVRHTVLAVYGGVYVDLDMMLLRPFHSLLHTDFAYRWSFRSRFNTAIIYFAPGSPTALRIAAEAIARAALLTQYAKLVNPRRIRAAPSFLRLPSAFFDPIWLLSDSGFLHYADPYNSQVKLTPSLFTKSVSDESLHQWSRVNHTSQIFFPGAYAFHWHNHWDIVRIARHSVAHLALKLWQEHSLIEQWVEL